METMKKQPDCRVDIGGLMLNNPVMTAAGTFGYAAEYQPFLDLNRLGAIIVKGLSIKPVIGNPMPRIVETPCGMLNAVGLENIGLEHFVRDKMPFLKTLLPPVIVNIYGKSLEDYAELAARLNEIEGIAGLEINISCPNVSSGGLAFGVDATSAFQVVNAVRKRTTKHVMVKLTPNVTDVTLIAQSAEDAGADAVSLINTITGMAIDIETRRSKLANITGGLSGPAIKPVALRMVWQVANAVKIPVVGIGGIVSAADALEFFIAGARAVQIGTANFLNPRTTLDIVDGIRSYLVKKRIGTLDDLIGTLNA